MIIHSGANWSTGETPVFRLFASSASDTSPMSDKLYRRMMVLKGGYVPPIAPATTISVGTSSRSNCRIIVGNMPRVRNYCVLATWILWVVSRASSESLRGIGRAHV